MTQAEYKAIAFTLEDGDHSHEVWALLRKRDRFPSAAWEDASVPPPLARTVLQVLAQTYDWPNCHMMPQDQLACLLQEGTHQLAFERFLLGVDQHLQVRLQPERVLSLIREGGTLLALVRLIPQDDSMGLDQQGRIDQDLPCCRCGYNLRTTNRQGSCPECGLPAERSVAGDPLRLASEAWIGTLHQGLGNVHAGLTCILWAILIAPVWPLVGIVAEVVGSPARIAPLPTRIVSISAVGLTGSLALLGLLLLNLGIWRIGTPELDLPPTRPQARRILRPAMVVAMALLAATFAVWTPPASVICFLGFLAALVVTLADLSLFIANLARRVPDGDLARDAMASVVAISLSGGVTVLLLSVGLFLARSRAAAFIACCILALPALLWILVRIARLRGLVRRCWDALPD